MRAHWYFVVEKIPLTEYLGFAAGWLYVELAMASMEEGEIRPVGRKNGEAIKTYALCFTVHTIMLINE